MEDKNMTKLSSALILAAILSMFLTLGGCIEQITHEQNLIWAQTPVMRGYSNSRLMSISGDPQQWVQTSKPDVRYIGAPHFTWEFKALGFHWKEQLLIWSESTYKKIQSCTLNGSLDTTTILAGTSSEVYGLTIDWLSHNIYYTDALYNWIMMKPMDPAKAGYKIIVQEGLDAPHGVAIDPFWYYLFWSDWGARPKIERAGLLGEDRRILVDKDLVKPHSITLDWHSKQIYWVDSAKGSVEKVGYEGIGRKVIDTVEVSKFYGIALYKDLIFVTDSGNNMLRLFTEASSTLSYKLGATPWGLVMYDQQPDGTDVSNCPDDVKTSNYWIDQPDCARNSTEVCDEMGCEQICLYHPARGATCLCGEGFEAADSDNKTCKPHQQFVHPSHFYAIGNSICRYPANMPDMSLDNLTLATQCFLGDKHSHPGYMTLTYDSRENMLYYFSNFTKTIARLPLEAGAKASVVDGGTGVVKGMTLDWVADNLYWTDSTHKTIMVSRKTGLYQRVLIDKLMNPVGVAVHPGRGELYWTDHGFLPEFAASVEMSKLDGTGRKIVMKGDVWQPNHLFIDFASDSLYWADSMQFHVRMLDMKSGRITVIYEQDRVKFYGISVFNDYLIWTDTESLNGVHMARMDKKEKIRGIIHPNHGVAADLITFDAKNQPDFTSPCARNVTKCFQLCLAPDNVTEGCYCSLGYSLSEDGYTCYTSPVQDDFLLVSDAFQKKIYQVNLLSGLPQAIDFDTINMAIAIAYDPFEYQVYWSDNTAKEIRSVNMDGSSDKTVVFLNSSAVCDGIALDHVDQLLFYTDTGNNLIGVVSIRKPKYYAYIITENLDQPRDIVISPAAGHIYWSDWGQSPGIEQANMDGTDRKVLYRPQGNDTKAWINGLALDAIAHVLYWVDAHEDSISSLHLHTGEVKPLVKLEKAHFFSVVVIGEYLYVTDWLQNYIQRMPKAGGSLEPFGPWNFTRLYGITGYNRTEAFQGLNVCGFSACGHLCLPKSRGGHTCRCSEGYMSHDNGVTCVRKPPPTTPAPTTLPPTTPQIPSGTTNVTTNTSTPSAGPFPSSSLSPLETTTTNPSRTNQPSASPTEQSTSPVPTATLTKAAYTVVMTTGMFTSGSNPATVDVIIGGDTPTTPKVENVGNDTVSRAPSKGGTTSHAGATVTIIICSVVACILIIVIIVIIVLYRKNYFYKVRHGKLQEDPNRASFYKIAFNERGETVTFDGEGGIENPTYDFMNGPGEGTSAP